MVDLLDDRGGKLIMLWACWYVDRCHFLNRMYDRIAVRRVDENLRVSSKLQAFRCQLLRCIGGQFAGESTSQGVVDDGADNRNTQRWPELSQVTYRRCSYAHLGAGQRILYSHRHNREESAHAQSSDNHEEDGGEQVSFGCHER